MFKYFFFVFYFVFGAILIHASEKDIVINLLASKIDNAIFISFTNTSPKESEILLQKDISIIIRSIEVKLYDEKKVLLFSIKPDFQKWCLPDWKILLPTQASIAIPLPLDTILLEKNVKYGRYFVRIHYGYFDMSGKYIILYSSELTPYSMSENQHRQNKNISEDEAIAIALKANMLNYDKSGKIKISLKDGVYTVTLPSPPLPPNSLGPDFAAKVEIDAKSGKVLSIMAGS